MAFTEEVKHFTELDEQGIVHHRELTITLKDGVEIARNNHRCVLTPESEHYGPQMKALSNMLYNQSIIAQQSAVTARDTQIKGLQVVIAQKDSVITAREEALALANDTIAKLKSQLTEVADGNA